MFEARNIRIQPNIKDFDLVNFKNLTIYEHVYHYSCPPLLSILSKFTFFIVALRLKGHLSCVLH